MIKKLFYMIVLGLIGYLIFMPTAIDQNKTEFEDAGALNTSVFDFLDPNQNQNGQDNTTDDES
jgi:hypothetical protein